MAIIIIDIHLAVRKQLHCAILLPLEGRFIVVRTL
jgi:hypothetical protein